MGLLESCSINVTPEIAIALGMLNGTVASRATGYVGTSATSGVAIRATAYSPQGANAQRSLKSSSASDAAAGAGARTVRVRYLTASFELKEEIVTLNGTAAVNMAAVDVAFVESMEVLTVGTQGGGNVGTVSLYTGTGGGGSVWASIAASDNQTFWAQHYVPAGVTCYLLNLTGGGSVVGGQVTVARSGRPLDANSPQRNVGGTYLHQAAGGNVDHQFRVPIAIPGPDFIWLITRPLAATASTAFGAFEYIQL